MARRFIRPRLVDLSGNVLRDGWLRVLDPDTAAEVDVFATSAGGSALTQPLTTDVRGEVECWLDAGTSVDLEWSDSGATKIAATGRTVSFDTFTEFVDADPVAVANTHAALPDLATSGHPAAAISGLGGAATLNVGTAAGTVAAGDDSRITGAVPKSTVTTAGDLIYGTGSAAVSRLGIGSPGQVLTAGASAPEWAAASSGSGLSLIGTASEWFDVAPGMIRLAFVEPVLTPGANKTIYMGPYHVAGPLTLGGGVFKVQAVTGTANVRFAVISMDTSTWQPSAVVKDLGELTYTSAGEKTVTFANVTVGAGWYFVGVRTDSASLAFSGMRMAPVSGWRGQQNGYLTYTHLTKSETYGAWASTPTAWDTVVAGSTTGIWGATHVLDWRLGA